MKEFIKNQKVTYNLMSFTGFKALLIFSLLADGPKSYEDINQYLFNHPYLREKISIDTLRVYINSLKRLGCEVKRIRGEDKISRYVITKHPFELKLTQDQIQSIIKVYKSIVKSMDIKEIISMAHFFEKIGAYIKNQEFVAEIKKISMLNDVDIKLLEDLVECCDKKEQIVILYNSPNSGKKNVELIADKIETSNGKIYLYGTGFEYMQYGSFLVSRIIKINEIKLHSNIPKDIKSLKIIYELNCDEQKVKLLTNEKIINSTNNKTIVEMDTSNEFLAKQRLLEYGPLCKILEPESFKKDFINLLKDMKAGYYCD